MCGYILAINLQIFTEIYLAQVKILQKVLGGLLFLTHTVQYNQSSSKRVLTHVKFTVLLREYRHN